MKKKEIAVLLILPCFLFCSCGSEAGSESAAENSSAVEITPLDQIQMNYQNNPYFDVSDLTYVGTYEQEFANGAGFENPEDNDPVFVWDKYISSDGETFCFDAKGRLRKYINAEYSNPDRYYTEETIENQITEKAKTSSELKAISEDIAKSYMVTDVPLSVEQFEGSRSYKIENASKLDADEDEVLAIVDLDSYGNIELFNASYEIISSPEDQDYFDQKIKDYIAEKKQISDIIDYTYRSRYEQVDNKVYAIYTITFEDSGEDYFCESVGFTKEIETDDSSGDVKE
ncbi:hypothetical protein [uncultured Ruminococcus sp.]|uniref:hypothetical protein n=1 Tax=uncultured Ruminococcus sp. TaxID=165186 RepID=UPI0025FA8F4E|nr:hypothetical protein [uncultured Ruminococcus sp.]